MLMPLAALDFEHMTSMAVARDWRLASTEQRAALVRELGIDGLIDAS